MTSKNFIARVVLLVAALILAGCEALPEVSKEPPPTATNVVPSAAPPTATSTPIPLATSSLTPSPTETRQLPNTTLPSPSASLAMVRTTPTPLGRPSPTSPATPGEAKALTLLAPLQVDGAGGRMFAPARLGADGPTYTAVFSTRDGGLLATWPVIGPLALDATRGRLYVDQGAAGLAVLDARTGALLKTIPLPTQPQDVRVVSPQADAATGQVFVMREHVVYVVQPDVGRVEPLAEFDLRPQDNCRQPHDAKLPIVGAHYDGARRILYLEFLSYACTPWFGYTVVAYDVTVKTELGRGGGSSIDAVVSNGTYYALSWHRFGIGTLWSLRDGRPWTTSTDWSGGRGGGLQVDTRRGRLYWSVGRSLRVLDANDLRLLMTVPLPRPGQLVGFDAVTDQAYFLSEGRLWALSGAAVRPPTAALLPLARPPARAVSRLAVSPAWPQDRSLVGIWGNDIPMEDCYVFAQTGGAPYLSRDGGQSWHALGVGLPSGCAYASAMALSPQYARDRTLWLGIAGTGVFKSSDGGALWMPTSAGLPSMASNALIVSPGFAADRTILAHVRTGNLQRSTDGGESWHSLPISPSLVAMSPEFDQDRTLIGYLSGYDRAGELRVSRDGGESWQVGGKLPGPEPLLMISIAPLYARWGVLFAYNNAGTLYRSGDGGNTWQAVLASSVTNSLGAQIAYAPNIETNRPVFLLVTGPGPAGRGETLSGRLFRSRDGGLTWEAIAVGQGAIPTALAISPNFARDRLIFVGTADGRILMLDGLALPKVDG